MNSSSSSTLIADLKTLPRAFWFLFVGIFINRFGTFVVPFFALYLVRIGHGKTEAGLAVSAYGIGQLLSTFFGGYLADRYGRRNILATSMFACALCMLGLASTTHFGSMVGFLLLTGLASGLGHPAANALVADLVPAHLRLRAYAAIRFAVNGGWACGAAGGGFILAYSPIWLFIGDALTSAIYGLVALIALPHGIRVTDRAAAAWGPALRLMARDRRLAGLFAASLLVGVIFHQTNTTYAMQVTAAGFSTKVFGLLFALNGVLIILFELPLTSWTRRRDPRAMMAAGFALIGLGMCGNVVGNQLFILATAMLVLTIGEMISLPVSSAYLAHLAPEAMRGRYMGAMSTAWGGSAVLGPALGMAVFRVSPTLLWAGCGILGLASAAIIFLSGHRASSRLIATGEKSVEFS